jgi:hypothetical protein
MLRRRFSKEGTMKLRREFGKTSKSIPLLGFAAKVGEADE